MNASALPLPMPQVEKISVFRNDQDSVLQKVKAGPVLLMQRSNPTCVLVDPAQWNAIALELQRYRALEIADQRAEEMRTDPSKRIPFTK